ncbi:MAG: DUF86 domain-containing protein [Candidatus Levybacteria bacterium]|nr:DUF86 domain-containing protein [Candidatus Levybacteria bacterium]
MKKDPRVYLDDILFSIDLIQQYITNVSFSSFDNSYDIQDKVLRRLEIIAEAAKRLPEEIRLEYRSIPWKSIIGLRNIITHTYDEVNLEEIWLIITQHLPETKKQIEEIQSRLQK